jgi:hypothetical protein
VIGERDRPDLGVAGEPRADTPRLVALEPDRDGVGHPVHVTLDRFDHVPHLVGSGVELDADRDARHRARCGGVRRAP